MITTSIIITVLELIIIVFGVSFYRHLSVLRTEESFKKASEDHKEMKEKIQITTKYQY